VNAQCRVITAIHFNTGRIGAHAPEFVRYCIEFAPGNEKTISDSSHRTVTNRRRSGRRPGQPEVRNSTGTRSRSSRTRRQSLSVDMSSTAGIRLSRVSRKPAIRPKGACHGGGAATQVVPSFRNRARIHPGQPREADQFPARVFLGARRTERERRAPGSRTGTRRACLGVAAHHALETDRARPQAPTRTGRLPRRDGADRAVGGALRGSPRPAARRQAAGAATTRHDAARAPRPFGTRIPPPRPTRAGRTSPDLGAPDLGATGVRATDLGSAGVRVTGIG
jgi:hypothetical protein